MHIKYLASYFANLIGIEANQDNTLRILSELKDRNVDVLPNALQELSPGMTVPMNRLQFVSPTTGIEILIATARLDIAVQKTSQSGSKELIPLVDFAALVDKCISAVFSNNKVVASRLALIVQDMHAEMSMDELNGVFPKLFKPPAFYNDHVPNEWTFRANAVRPLEFGSYKDEVNSICKIDRIQGRMMEGGVAKEVKRIFTEIDINTSALNTVERYPPESLRDFVNKASAEVVSLEAGIANALQ